MIGGNPVEFQSTPLREGRQPSIPIVLLPLSFQSTPLREGRPFHFRILFCNRRFQSTPLREGRLKKVACCLMIGDFNPRPCVRGDANLNCQELYLKQFQSTPLREGRPEDISYQQKKDNFNPRPCVRGDSKYSQNYINKRYHIVNFAK